MRWERHRCPANRKHLENDVSQPISQINSPPQPPPRRFRAPNPLSSSFSAPGEEKKRESGEVENIGQALQEEAIVIVHPF